MLFKEETLAHHSAVFFSAIPETHSGTPRTPPPLTRCCLSIAVLSIPLWLCQVKIVLLSYSDSQVELKVEDSISIRVGRIIIMGWAVLCPGHQRRGEEPFNLILKLFQRYFFYVCPIIFLLHSRRHDGLLLLSFSAALSCFGFAYYPPTFTAALGHPITHCGWGWYRKREEHRKAPPPSTDQPTGT